MENHFETLNQALKSEGLLDTWDCFNSIDYGMTYKYYANGESISISRLSNGLYERPIHYKNLH